MLSSEAKDASLALIDTQSEEEKGQSRSQNNPNGQSQQQRSGDSRNSNHSEVQTDSIVPVESDDGTSAAKASIDESVDEVNTVKIDTTLSSDAEGNTAETKDKTVEAAKVENEAVDSSSTTV